jgi:hypothetical protein
MASAMEFVKQGQGHVVNHVMPNIANDIGDRMTLVPQEVDPHVSENEIKRSGSAAIRHAAQRRSWRIRPACSTPPPFLLRAPASSQRNYCRVSRIDKLLASFAAEPKLN